MAFDPSELFGSPREEDPRAVMNMILAFLQMVLSSKRDEDHVQDEREQGSHEIPVRPRIEPLGGGG